MHDLNNNTTAPFIKTEETSEVVSASDIILVISALLLSVFITFVNSITIIVIRRTPSLHTLSNIYVTSLAVSDLVVGLCLIPLSLFYIPHIKLHYFDENVKLCVFVLGVNLGMALVSSLQMSLIATDRYAYIIHPYRYQKVVDRKFISLLLCGTWAFGVIYALLPQVIHNKESMVPKCDITLAMPIEYLFFSTMSLYSICVIVDVSMYTQILYAAYKQRRLIQSMTGVVGASKPADTFSVSIINVADSFQNRDTNRSGDNVQLGALPSLNHQHIASHRPSVNAERRQSTMGRSKQRSRMKSVRFFFTVFGVYFVCVTPTIVCMGVDYYTVVPRFLYNMFNLLALLNSGMNFIIFFALNSRFRIGVLRLLRWKGAENIVINGTEATLMDS